MPPSHLCQVGVDVCKQRCAAIGFGAVDNGALPRLVRNHTVDSRPVGRAIKVAVPVAVVEVGRDGDVGKVKRTEPQRCRQPAVRLVEARLQRTAVCGGCAIVIARGRGGGGWKWGRQPAVRLVEARLRGVWEGGVMLRGVLSGVMEGWKGTEAVWYARSRHDHNGRGRGGVLRQQQGYRQNTHELIPEIPTSQALR
eukprot:360354-Chlamydomonas_euryale.AAC.4